MSASFPELASAFASFVEVPLDRARRGIDGMKMTALSAWAVDTLSKDGADAVEVQWSWASPVVGVSATYVDGKHYSSTGFGRRDFAVMGAVGRIIDDRAAGSRSWRDILGLDQGADLQAAERAYIALVRGNHPDLGGDHETMVQLNVAREAAREELLAA